MQPQIRLHKLHLLANLHRIRRPIDILPLHDGKFFYHLCDLMLIPEYTVHSYTFQRIKQKMGINLAMKCQKLCILSCDIHLLLSDTVLVDCLNQLVCPRRHSVIVFHQPANLITAADCVNLAELLILHLVKHLAELLDSHGERTVQFFHQQPRKNRVGKNKQRYQRQIFPYCF